MTMRSTILIFIIRWVFIFRNFRKAIVVFHRLITSCSTCCHEKWHSFDQV